MSNIIKTFFIFTLLFALFFNAHSPAPAPQLGSDDSLSPSLSPPAPSPESDLTPPPSSPLTPSPENVKSEERKEDGSGGKKARIVVGVVSALCVVWLGHLCNNHHINQPNLHNNHINQPNPGFFVFVMGHPIHEDQHYLIGPESIIPLATPDSLRSLRNITRLNHINGYQCFIGYHVLTRTRWVVIWNPVDDTVAPIEKIDVTNYQGYASVVVGFGVSRVTGDGKLVKISAKDGYDGRPAMWDVDVFSVSTRDWINVHSKMRPFRLCRLACAKVCAGGRIYFRAYDLQDKSEYFVSLDLETMEFGDGDATWFT